MDLHLFSDDERRAHCRRELEGLEHWLRRLVHETFSDAHGAHYLDAVDRGGRRVIKKKVADDIRDRLAKEPQRYNRPLDAARLDDLKTIICHPENWRHYFAAALGEAFPGQSEEARVFLGRLVDIRNKLSHANPISVHEAARVICYTLDVIESIKGYYMARNLEKEYNVPTIIRVTDSLGNVCDVSGMRHVQGESGVTCQFNETSSGSLRPGERLSIEIEVDPSFERSSYRIRWSWPGICGGGGEAGDTERLVFLIESRHVRREFVIWCYVISIGEWHKLGDYDDVVGIVYRILPPLS